MLRQVLLLYFLSLCSVFLLSELSEDFPRPTECLSDDDSLCVMRCQLAKVFEHVLGDCEVHKREILYINGIEIFHFMV